jgi:hypothetical protein
MGPTPRRCLDELDQLKMAAAFPTDKRRRIGTEQQRVPIPRQARRSQAVSFVNPGRATDRQVRLAIQVDVETGNAVIESLGRL